MSDGQLLLIALGAFTLFECARWVPVRAWVFQAAGGGSWRGAGPWELFRTRGGGIAMLMPVPPLEPHVVTAAWPCAPHEQGLCVWDDESGVARHVPWDQVRPHADGAALHFTTEHRVRCVHAASAKAWEELAKSWVAQPQDKRRESFLKRARTMLDEKPLIQSVDSLRKDTRWLRCIGGWIFFWCFLMLPVTYWRFADAWPMLAAIGVLFAMMLTQAVLLWRQVHRDPRLREGAAQHLLSAALFPPASMRAGDWICAVRPPEAHPLAAFKAWRTAEELEKVLAPAWREARWPLGDFPSRPWNGPEVEALTAFIETHGINRAALETPPSLPDGCARWCPRCHTTYQDSATECADCGGMKLSGS